VKKIGIIVLAIMILQLLPFAAGCGGLPQAAFQASTVSGQAPLDVVFTNQTQKIAPDSLVIFDWDFGDGSKQTGTKIADPVTHQYTKAGTYTVTLTEYSSDAPDKTNIVTQKITVEHGALTKVSVTPETVELKIGDVQAFASAAFDAFDNPITEAALIWSAGDAGTVTTDGSFTAGHTAGVFSKGVISIGDLSGTKVEGHPVITILPDPLITAALDPLNIEAGESKQLVAVGKDQYGNSIENLEASWTVVDSKAGTITSSGLFTASKRAVSYKDAIKVTIKQGDKTTVASSAVNIKAGELDQIAIAPGNITLGKGMTQQYVAAGADKYGNRITGITFTWSAAESAGTITSGGLFTASNNPSDYKTAVTVTAKYLGAEVKKNAEINVEDDTIIFYSDKSDTTNHVMKYYTMDTNGNNIKILDLTSSGKLQDKLNGSRDGRRLIYNDIQYDDQGYYVSDHTWISSTDGTWPMNISSGNKVYEVALSPDGTKIAYQSWKTDEPEICVMNIDGSNIVNLTNNNLYDDYPDWSPDGKQIIFVSKADAGALTVPKIFIMNSDGSGRHQITTTMGYETMPKWSPDGKKIVYQSGSFSTGLFSICTMNADGTNKRTLTEENYDAEYASWSPDGNKIVFTSNKTDNQYDVYVVNADGTNMVRLTESTGTDFSPIWLLPKQGIKVDPVSVVIKEDFGEQVMTAQQISSANKNAVVRIEVTNAEGTGYGTGFIIKSDGVILTANHVISGGDKITVFTTEGQKLTGTVIARDIVHDLALIKVQTNKLPVIQIGTLGGVDVGQQVVVIGYPLGNENVSVTSGLVSSVQFDDGTNITWIQTDSAINPGNSGGPLLDMSGQVIGLVTMKVFGVGIEGLGYAISASTLNMYLPQLLTEAGITL
jgi:Tol biopolymer transport system component